MTNTIHRRRLQARRRREIGEAVADIAYWVTCLIILGILMLVMG